MFTYTENCQHLQFENSDWVKLKSELNKKVMEQRLKNYRAEKQRKHMLNQFKTNVTNFFNRGKFTMLPYTTVENVPSQDETSEELSENDSKEYLISESDEENSTPKTQASDGLESPEESKIYTYSLRILYFLLWITLYMIAIELKFGIVFLILSAIFGIYFNTRTGPKPDDEVSAYSVFNKNCKSIDGTLKAEQFEQEMRYGFASVH